MLQRRIKRKTKHRLESRERRISNIFMRVCFFLCLLLTREQRKQKTKTFIVAESAVCVCLACVSLCVLCGFDMRIIFVFFFFFLYTEFYFVDSLYFHRFFCCCKALALFDFFFSSIIVSSREQIDETRSVHLNQFNCIIIYAYYSFFLSLFSIE